MSQASSSPIDPERRDDIQAVPSPAALRAAQRTSSMSQTSHSPTFPTPPEKGSVVPLPNIEGPVWEPSPYMTSAQKQLSSGDSSEPLFDLYSKLAKDEDDEMTEHWKHEATDGVLIFTGLFSAAVAALLTVSVQDLRVRPESQDTSAFYLANIYQVLAVPNVTAPHPSILSTAATPPPFSPPRYAIWVNSLWFLSLVISFTCALLAMMLRQWAYRYTRLTQQARRRPEERARMRAFFADGVDKMHLRRAVEILPALIHIYLFLFFAGLAIFLFNINRSVFVSVIWWIGLSLMAYVWVTVMPVLWPHSPCYAPFSSLVWSLLALLTYARYRGLASITRGFGSPWTSKRFHDLSTHYRGRMARGMWRAAEENALKPSPEIDWHIWKWTMRTVGESYFLQDFIRAIPGFFQSRIVSILGRRLYQDKDVLDLLNAFLRRALSSDSEVDKDFRLDIYLKTMDAISEPSQVLYVLSDILRGEFGQLPQSFQTANILARWCTAHNEHIAIFARCLVAILLPAIQNFGPYSPWINLAKDQLSLPEDILRDNTPYRNNSLSLYILVHVTRQMIHTDFHTHTSSWRVLSSLSKFDIHNTVPGLQHEFCALWNEIVREARATDPRYPYVYVLRSIGQLYIALHQGTDAAPTAFDASTRDLDILDEPSSYPFCNIDTHVPSPLEIQPVPGTGGIFASFADDTPLHAQGFPSLPSTTDPVYVPPRGHTL